MVKNNLHNLTLRFMCFNLCILHVHKVWVLNFIHAQHWFQPTMAQNSIIIIIIKFRGDWEVLLVTIENSPRAWPHQGGFVMFRPTLKELLKYGFFCHWKFKEIWILILNGNWISDNLIILCNDIIGIFL